MSTSTTIPDPASACSGPCLQEDDVSVGYDDQAQWFCLRGDKDAVKDDEDDDPWLNEPFPLRTTGVKSMRYLIFNGDDDETRVLDKYTNRSEPDRVFYIYDCEKFVAPKHCEILVDIVGGKAFLRDLGTQKGTFLNGVKLYPFQKYDLTCGDILSLGESFGGNNELKDLKGKKNVFIYNVLHSRPVVPSEQDWSILMPEMKQHLCLFLDKKSLKAMRLVDHSWGSTATDVLTKRLWPIHIVPDTYYSPNINERQKATDMTDFVQVFEPEKRFLTPKHYGIVFDNQNAKDPHHLGGEVTWFFTDYFRHSRIPLRSVSLFIDNIQTLANEKDFLKMIFEDHASTLEQIALNFADSLTAGNLPRADLLPIPTSTTTVLRRVKKLQLVQVFGYDEDDDEPAGLQVMEELGNMLTSFMPNVETLNISHFGAFKPLLESMLKGRLLPKLSSLALYCDTLMPHLPLMPMPALPPRLRKVTIDHFKLFRSQHLREKQREMFKALMTRTFYAEELELVFTIDENVEADEDNVLLVDFPRLPNLKKLTILVEVKPWNTEDDEEKMVPLKASFGNKVLNYSLTFPQLETLEMSQAYDDEDSGVDPNRQVWCDEKMKKWKVDWTSVFQAFFRKNDEKEGSKTLKWITLPPKITLQDLDSTPEALKAKFPNLKKIFDQNNMELI